MGRDDPQLEQAERRLLHAFLAGTAQRAPDAVAIDVPAGRGRPERQVLRYGELDAGSDRLARHLAPLLAPEAIVPLLLPRTSPLLHVAQLAVLKAGGAFTCLDPSFPTERMREILADADATLVLADHAGLARLSTLDAEGLRLLDPGDLLATEPPAGPLPEIAPERLAYVIYTSGTTGRPKGVMIEHRSIANLVHCDIAEFGLTPADRVVQGSSPAYDSFLEETWLAFAAGATLLVMDDDTARLGPDLVAWLDAKRATVFCPPPTLLRSTGCRNPAEALPDLRLLYVGGEALPDDVADLWAQGRRLVNGYGPTECAVTCIRTDIRPDEPVTIGRPVPGMAAWVLDEHLASVPDGGRGELCLSGIGVARGYRNRPDVSAEKFVDHPELGRLYRTGDLVHRDASGCFHYHGRIDAQVKIRGHRVELAEIEARLAARPGVRAAAARLQEEDEGAAELVAWIVCDDPARPPDPETLKAALAATLPRHMVPRQIGVLGGLPTTVGGKLDRKALPAMTLARHAEPRHGAAPATPLERQLAEAVADILKRRGEISVDDDFFESLGGDSLSAAMLVTLLREDPATDWITVSDVYEARTVRKLAETGASRVEAVAAAIPFHREGRARPLLTAAVQTLWLAGELVVGSWIAWAVAFRLLPFLLGNLGLVGLLLLAPLVGLLAVATYVPAALGFAMAVKRLVIGRYRPLRTPYRSAYYARHWIVMQAARLIPWALLQGTVFQQAALRALGAKIGRRVHIHRGVDLGRGGWDLLEIGDDASLGQDVHLGLVEIDRGDIVVGPVVIGAGASLRVRAAVEGGCSVGAGAELAPLSILCTGAAIPPGERWDGVPAGPAGAAEAPPSTGGAELTPWLHGLLTMAAKGGAAALALLPAELLTLAVCAAAGVGVADIWRWLYRPTLDAALVAIVLGLTVVSLPLTLVANALLLRALGPVKAGTISRWSPAYIRVWLKTGILFNCGEWLSGAIFWPQWLRLAGMRVGSKCEISTIIDVVPELVTIGPETFFADGIYLGGAEVTAGAVTLAPVKLGRNTFLGNHAVVPAGETLPDDILIGIATVADSRHIAAGHSRFGHPSFDLPRREVIEIDRRLTHDPSPLRYGNRLFWETLRFALPIVPLLLTTWWYAMLATGAGASGPWTFALAMVPGATVLTLAAACAFVLALKWLLIGRVKPGQHALWSCWCSRWDFLYVAWGRSASRILQQFEGTGVLVAYLRLMGVKIGKGALLGPQFSQVVDPDMIDIGAGATVSAMFQAHTFEDRVLKVGKVTIGAGATVAFGTVPLYGAAIGESAHVGGHSVVMKHEHLRPGLRYQGVPTRVFGREAVPA
ncbi:MAG: amino acid adenylation domain-containing protein [Alphaproteobacteria bacterium]|nr:amino acid adenylation domain-containing protein [Alphaproteobacteria bacterium]